MVLAMIRIAAFFLLVLPLAAVKTTSKDALGLGLDAEAEERPVMKVVTLLQDMNKQLQADLEDDKDVHEKMTCWCDENEKEKTKAIEDGGIEIERLKAFLGEAAGKIAEMKVKRKETKEELEADQKALSTATALRMKDNQDFAKDEKDTTVAIKAVKDSITVLKKQNTGLIEVRQVASVLKKARVAEAPILDNLKRAALKDFLRDAEGATSFLSIPGFKSYGSQSGQIFGILNQMLDDFESHLTVIQSQEKQAESDYQALKKAKEDQIADGKKDIIDLDKRLGTTGEKRAQAEKDLKDTTEQLANDQEFLGNLQKKCTEHNEEFDTRIKDRLTEIEAVEGAIRILNDEDSFKLFDKTLSFLQISSTAEEKEQMSRQSAASTLERAAAETDSPILAMLAGRVRLDAFTEVKKAISGMVEELTKQQKDEVEHKAWCVKEFDENTKDTAAADAKKDTLTVKRDDLKKTIETLSTQIKNTKDQVAEIKKQMARASDTREAANADYQQTITDQRMTQMVLNKALTTMKQVYALLQQRGKIIKLSGNKVDPGSGPAKFKAGGKNANGAKIMSMLESIITDAKKAEADAIKAEQNAQTSYETFMLDSNKAIEKKSEQIMTLSGNKAKAEEDLNMAKKDLAATIKKLSNLADEKDDLHGSCDFIIKNFKTRQDARQAEIDALNEAMAILSGAK
jgi:hypothetical protein